MKLQRPAGPVHCLLQIPLDHKRGPAHRQRTRIARNQVELALGALDPLAVRAPRLIVAAKHAERLGPEHETLEVFAPQISRSQEKLRRPLDFPGGETGPRIQVVRVEQVRIQTDGLFERRRRFIVSV